MSPMKKDSYGFLNDKILRYTKLFTTGGGGAWSHGYATALDLRLVYLLPYLTNVDSCT